MKPNFNPKKLNIPKITHIQLSPKINTNHITRSRQKLRNLSLNQQFPYRVPKYKIQIQNQPEKQHKTKYLTKKNKNTIKNKTKNEHTIIKIHNSKHLKHI